MTDKLYCASKIEEHGLPVSHGYQPPMYLPHSPPKDMTAVAVLDNGVERFAVDVSKPEQLGHYFKKYTDGLALRFNLFLVPNDKISLCPDQGKEPSTIHEPKATPPAKYELRNTEYGLPYVSPRPAHNYDALKEKDNTPWYDRNDGRHQILKTIVRVARTGQLIP